MKKIKAMEEADAYFMETKEHAHVVTMSGDFEWFPHSYFDNGINEPMKVVYSTWNQR